MYFVCINFFIKGLDLCNEGSLVDESVRGGCYTDEFMAEAFALGI